MLRESAIFRVKETFENWTMYEAVIRHNYMSHNELVSGLKAIAVEVAGGLTIVDLGCGDAWLASHAFADAKVESYTAVDLSESAIERAGKNTARWGAAARLCCGNIVEFVKTLPDRSANLILASNSLHHFDAEGKAAILRNCFSILAPRGIFCWIDPVRSENENRDQYLGRLTSIMQNDWVELTLDQRRHATEHVWSSDYPETEQWMCEQSIQAGFQLAGRFLETDLFGGWKFVKP